MGNPRSRQWRREQDEKASWERLRSAPWQPDSAIRAFGSGAPRIQVIHCPSFEPSSFWEVCEIKPDWALYTSAVVGEWFPGPVTVKGYERVAFPSKDLRRFFEQLISISLPLRPLCNGMGGLDGELTQLAIFGDLDSQVRFQWCSDYPPNSAPLARLAEEMRTAFAKAVTE